MPGRRINVNPVALAAVANREDLKAKIAQASKEGTSVTLLGLLADELVPSEVGIDCARGEITKRLSAEIRRQLRTDNQEIGRLGDDVIAVDSFLLIVLYGANRTTCHVPLQRIISGIFLRIWSLFGFGEMPTLNVGCVCWQPDQEAPPSAFMKTLEATLLAGSVCEPHFTQCRRKYVLNDYPWDARRDAFVPRQRAPQAPAPAARPRRRGPIVQHAPRPRWWEVWKKDWRRASRP